MLQEDPDTRHLLAAEEQVVEVLIQQHVQVSCDVVPIDEHTWAIHGSIAVDGEVILAEFDDRDHAALAAQEIALSTLERGTP
jgi:hypothetical protein